MNKEEILKMMFSLYYISSLMFPFFGIIADKIGKRINLLLIGSFISLICFLLLPYINKYISLILLCLSFSISGAISHPVLAYLIPNNKLVKNK